MSTDAAAHPILFITIPAFSRGSCEISHLDFFLICQQTLGRILQNVEDGHLVTSDVFQPESCSRTAKAPTKPKY